MAFIKLLASYYRQHLVSYHRFQPHQIMVPGLHEIATMTDAASKQNMDHVTNAPTNSIPSLPPTPPPRQFPFYTWAKWALGSILTIVLPFWDKRWRSLLRLEGEIEMATEAVEHVADAVEKVATVTEKMAADAAESMKEDGTLKNAVILVEHFSKEVAEEAHLTKDIIHKVEDLKKEVETLIEPLEEIEKAVDKLENQSKI